MPGRHPDAYVDMLLDTVYGGEPGEAVQAPGPTSSVASNPPPNMVVGTGGATYDKGGAEYNLKSYGALLDGVSDDTAIINSTLNTVKTNGGTIVQNGIAALAGIVTIPTTGLPITWAGKGWHSGLIVGNADAYVVATSTTQFHFRDMKVLSTQTATNGALHGLLAAQSAVGLRVSNCRWDGAGAQISLNNCTYFSLLNNYHVNSTSPGVLVQLASNCRYGVVIGMIVEPTTMVTHSSQVGLLNIQSSDHIAVLGFVARNCDATQAPSSFAIGFSTATFCTLSDSVVSGCQGMDAAVVQQSSDIDGSCSNLSFNGTAVGVGTHHETGDGLDIFQSNRIRFSNMTLRGNGTYASAPHYNLEINTCNDVTVSVADASDGGTHGISVAGSPDTTLIGVVSRRNKGAGLSATQFATVESTNLKIIGGDFWDNGQGAGAVGTLEGIYLANATTAQITSVTANESRAGGARTQTYGLRIENTAKATVIGGDFTNNLTGPILDSVGTSSISKTTGYIAESSGSGTLAAAATTAVTFATAMGKAPPAALITLTFTGDHTQPRVWLTAISTTGFTINFPAAAAAVGYSYAARVAA